MSSRRIALLLGLITLAGLILRLFQYDQSLMGDELSTLWIVENNSLRGTIDVVRSHAEITPPFSFVLSWFAAKLGSDPNLIRVPSLIAGTVSIPLLYLLGKRTIGVVAGLAAATVMALSPFMTYFSGNGRAYAVMLLLLIGSTLLMLKAAEDGRARWWIGYAVLSCLAMYTHYTAMFVLLAQLLWLLWVHPAARRPAILANLGAAVFFIPWVPGLRADFDSPTQPVLEALQTKGFDGKRYAFEQWGFGHPLIDPAWVPGRFVMIVIAAGLAAAAVLTARKLWAEAKSRSSSGEKGSTWPIPSGLVLVLLIAIATPLGEALLALVGTDLLGSRNMTASWYGFALSIGALITIPGGMLAVACTCVVLGGYGAAAANLLRGEAKVFNVKGPAKTIDAEAGPGDVVVDMNAVLTTPVPQTPLDAYMKSDVPVFLPRLPLGDPPFLPLTPIREPNEEFAEAFAQAEGHRVFLLAPELVTVEESAQSGKKLKRPVVEPDRVLLPAGAEIVETESFPSYYPWNLYTITVE